MATKKYVINLNLNGKKTIELNISGLDEKVTNSVNKKRKKKNIFVDGFFGWDNIKWFIREVGKIYSSEHSYFSKKRLESSIAFVIAEWGMVLYLMENYSTLSMSDFLMWVGAEFIVAGYYVTQIQKEKRYRGYDNTQVIDVDEEQLQSYEENNDKAEDSEDDLPMNL